MDANSSVENGSKMYRAANKGNWRMIKKAIKEEPSYQSAPMSPSGATILHLVAQFRQEKTLVNILELMTADAMSSRTAQGNTVLHEVAIVGSMEMAAKAVCRKKHRLVTVCNHFGETPVFLAASYGRKDVFWYPAMEAEMSCQGNYGATILRAAMVGEFYGIFGTEKVERYPSLAVARDEKGVSPLHIMANSPKSFKSGTLYYLTNIGVSTTVVLEIIGKVIYSSMFLYKAFFFFGVSK
ncbi:hypothetical protein AMTR_s00149p00086010 [Amborella trichopoda]|uniref:Uncharacterized protein n=1 Tax=Amborella trichopoda TaxID=13333 RepID=W1PH38_AMBTC|nr:hypothetical protein AMTR_s00149p00086010 [Amborella trichopoda]